MNVYITYMGQYHNKEETMDVLLISAKRKKHYTIVGSSSLSV